MTLYEILQLLSTVIIFPWFWLALFAIGILIGTIRHGLSGLPLASLKTVFVLIAPITAYIFTFSMLDERALDDVRDWYHWHATALPVVLWSGICWFGLEIYRPQSPANYWLIVGQCTGSLLCIINLLLGTYFCTGLTSYEFNDQKIAVITLLLLASGTTLWHVLRSINVLRHTNLNKTRIALFTTAVILLWLIVGTNFWLLNTA